MLYRTRVIFEKPDYESLRKAGFTLTDMHFHTRYSDTFTRISSILKKASNLGINVAITDHNSIEGVRRAYNNREKINIIPGIEVSCFEGHHILLYFATFDQLEHFYNHHIKGKLSTDPYSCTYIKTQELLEAIKGYECLSVAAHPYGFGHTGIVHNTKRGLIRESVLHSIDAFEVICGTNLRKANELALELAEAMDKPITGGSDGHSLGQLGNVVVCTKAKTTKGILNEIREKRNLVIGRESKLKFKIMAGSKLTIKHLPYIEHTIAFRYKNIYKKSFKHYSMRLRSKLP